MHLSCILEKRKILSIGGYSNRLKQLADYELLLRMMSQGYLFHNIPKYLYYYRNSSRHYLFLKKFLISWRKRWGLSLTYSIFVIYKRKRALDTAWQWWQIFLYAFPICIWSMVPFSLKIRKEDTRKATKRALTKQKITLFLPHLQGGGAEKMMLNLAEGFSKKGLSVDLLLANAKGDYLNYIPDNVRLIDLKSRHIALSFHKYLRYLRTERCKTVLATFGADVLSLTAKKFFNRNLRVFIRMERPISTDLSFRYGLLWGTSFKILQHLLPCANGIIPVSHEAMRDVKKIVPKTSSLMKMIYNPIVRPDIIEKSLLSPGHPWMKKKNDIPVILSIGRLVADKDHGTLLKAFGQIVKISPARLIFLGQGPLEKKLKNDVKNLGLRDCVNFSGFQTNPYAFMAHANLTVLSSIAEGLPSVLIESMACGTPVVSTDCLSGPREILADGRYGRLVPVGDDESLAEAMIQTLKHPLQKDILKQRANDFSAEHCIDQYMQFLGYA